MSRPPNPRPDSQFTDERARGWWSTLSPRRARLVGASSLAAATGCAIAAVALLASADGDLWPVVAAVAAAPTTFLAIQCLFSGPAPVQRTSRPGVSLAWAIAVLAVMILAAIALGWVWIASLMDGPPELPPSELGGRQ